MLMKKILNVSEMKQVRGGAQPSSSCGEGELLYTCTSSWMGGATTSGSVCAKSAKRKIAGSLLEFSSILFFQNVIL